MARLIDTNALLRVLLGDVPEQAKRTMRWLAAAEPATIEVLDAVLVEALFQLESKRGAGLKRDAYLGHVVALLEQPCFSLSNTTWRALTLYQGNPKLDYVDCVLLAASVADASVEVFTFDKELRAALSAAKG